MQILDRLKKNKADGYTIVPLDTMEAWVMAKQLHSGQVRWYTDEPYFKHCERVAESVARSPEYHVAEADTKRVMLVSAILHDSVEDTELTLDDVIDFCGPEVAEVVELLTHDEGTPYHAYMANLLDNPIARVIKRADTCDNLATLPFDDEHSARLWKKYEENIRAFAIWGGA